MTQDYQVRNYPGAAVKSRLTIGMTNVDTTTSVETVTNWPTANFWMVIDAGLSTEEVVFVAARAANALSGMVRNITGTGAFTHAALGSNLCYPVAISQDFTEANAVAAALTTKGDSLWKGGTLSVAPARLAAGSDQQIIRYKAANSLGVETTHLGGIPVFTSTALRDAAIAAPVGGQLAYIFAGAATDGLYTYNGVAWRPQAWNEPWGLVASASSTSSQTGITATADVTFATATWTAVTNRLYRISASILPAQITAGGTQQLLIESGASGSGTLLGFMSSSASVNAGATGPGNIYAFQTGSGSISAHLQASTSGGTLTVNNAGMKGWFVVEDIGPTGVPA
jgi:hypothetical protein